MVSDCYGLDLGMGAIKINNGDRGIECLSHIALNNYSKISNMVGLSAIKTATRVTLSTGETFIVGKGAQEIGRPLEDFGMGRFRGTSEMQALVFGAFTRFIQQYGEIEESVKMYCGLPIEILSGDNAKKTVLEIQHWLKKTHSWEVDSKKYFLDVSNVRVTSQPAGAFFDYILDTDGKINPDRQISYTHEIGVISVGMNTIELLVIKNKSVLERFTAGTTSGVRRLLELVNANQSYSICELDSLLRSNNLDISQALPIWEREVTGEIEKRWGKSWKRFEVVLIVGGGAILLKNSLPYYFQGKAFVPEDPVMSIARGLYKLGQYQNKPKNE